MKLNHWSYFLTLEEDLLRLSRFVEFNEGNYTTFSIEMVHLLLAASSENDVVLKMLCKPFDPATEDEGSYRVAIPKNIQDFTKLKVEMPRYDLNFQPWQSWNDNQTPDWWTANNKVKHKRDSHFEKANLKNVLNSMAGLFVSNLYFYKDLANHGELGPWPQLFYPEDKYVSGMTPGEGGFVLRCKL